MLITGLPEYYDGCYKVEDVVQLLVPFGFQDEDNNVYVVPQIRMVTKKIACITWNKTEVWRKRWLLLAFICVFWVSGFCQDANNGVCAQPDYESQGRRKDDFQRHQNLLPCPRL